MDVERQPPIARGWRIFFNTNHANFWYGLIVIGILMRLFGSLISSLHVDTHMHVAYATNFVEIGVFELDWGPARNPFFPDASNPDGAGSDVGWAYAFWHLWLAGWVALFGRSENVIHMSSLCISAVLIFTTWKLTKSRFGKHGALRVTALVAIHPSLVAASINGLQEEAIALFLMLGCAAALSGLDQLKDGRKPFYWATIPLIALIVSMIKGVGTTIPLVGSIIVILWLVMERRFDPEEGMLRKQPILFLSGLAVFVWVALLLPAWLNPSAGWSLSWSVVNLWPFLQAIVVTIVVFGLLWGGIGLLAWPYATSIFRRLKKGDIPSEALHLLLFTWLSFCVIVLFNASFWAHEGSILGMSIFETSSLYYRNGRYVSLLLIPFQWLLLLLVFHSNKIPEDINGDEEAPSPLSTQPIHRDDFTLGAQSGVLLVTILILISMSSYFLFMDEHDAEDVSETVGSILDDEGEFLLVTPPKAGMHRLYEHHMGVDPDLSRDILGHWRSDGHDWKSELSNCSQLNDDSGNLANVSVVVLDPYVDDEMDVGWTQIEESGSEGWRVFTWDGSSPRCQ